MKWIASNTADWIEGATIYDDVDRFNLVVNMRANYLSPQISVHRSAKKAKAHYSREYAIPGRRVRWTPKPYAR